MSKLRRQLSVNTGSSVETKNLLEIKGKTGNLYESIAIIAKRANQINISLREELHNKLEEFASHTDSLEEIHENKEQIEISRAYERMPNPALLASQEFLEDKVYFRKNDHDLFPPAVAAYWQRLQGRPAFQRALRVEREAAQAQGVDPTPSPDLRF